MQLALGPGHGFALQNPTASKSAPSVARMKRAFTLAGLAFSKATVFVTASRMCSLYCAVWGMWRLAVMRSPLISTNMFGFTRTERDMDAADQALLLIGLVTCLGACLVAGLYELERWRERRRGCEDMIRAATRLVVVPKDRE